MNCMFQVYPLQDYCHNVSVDIALQTVNDNLWLKIQCLTGYRPTALQMIDSLEGPGSASKLAYDWLVDILGFAVAF